MAWWFGLRQRVKAVLRRREMELEMEEELQYHLDQAIERNVARGMDRVEARRFAMQDFGGVERRKEQMRDERGMRPLLDFTQNLKYAFRHLKASPGFTTIAVLIMGVGIGATTAIFSIVNSILIRPIYCENPAEVVRIYTYDPETGRPRWNSYPDYQDIRNDSDIFSAIGVTSDIFPFSLVTENGAETVLSDVFSAGIFPALGIKPYLGRSFLPEEDIPGAAEPVVMIAHSAWKERHGSDPDIVGKTIRLNGYLVTVVGIGPPGFKGVFIGVVTEYWVSWGTSALINARRTEMEARDSGEVNIFARMKPGVSEEMVRSVLDVIAARLANEYPATNSDMSFLVKMFNDVRTDPVVDSALYPLSGFLMSVVVLVLLVACSNLAGFLLMRATSRRKEITVRIALGAGRGRLISELLTENLILGLAGGMVGLIIAFGLANAASSYKIPLPFALSMDFGLDSTVLIFTIILSMVTGILIGLVPAFQSSKPDVVTALKDDNLTITMSRKGSTLRNLFIIAQVSVSMVLLIGAALFIRSLDHRRNVDLGFESDKQAVLIVDVGLGGYTDEESARVFLERYRDNLRSQPEIESVALASRIPFGLFNAGAVTHARLPESTTFTETEKEAVKESEAEEVLSEFPYAEVSPDFFTSMGIPLSSGRIFSTIGSNVQSNEVIVSEDMAQLLWGESNATGQFLLLGEEGDARLVEVIGVAGNVKVRSLAEESNPFLYLPFAGRYSRTTTLVARTMQNPQVLPDIFRRELSMLDRRVAILDARTMTEHLDITFFLDRTAAIYLSVLGMLAMVLASVGLYGTVAFSVTQRTREVGIRMALGANRAQVIRMVVRQAIRLLMIGIVTGLVVSGLVMQILSRLLMGVSPVDPVAFVSVVLVLGTVTVLASYLPAQRAARMNPMSTLRYE